MVRGREARAGARVEAEAGDRSRARPPDREEGCEGRVVVNRAREMKRGAQKYTSAMARVDASCRGM